MDMTNMNLNDLVSAPANQNNNTTPPFNGGQMNPLEMLASQFLANNQPRQDTGPKMITAGGRVLGQDISRPDWQGQLQSSLNGLATNYLQQQQMQKRNQFFKSVNDIMGSNSPTEDKKKNMLQLVMQHQGNDYGLGIKDVLVKELGQPDMPVYKTDANGNMVQVGKVPKGSKVMSAGGSMAGATTEEEIQNAAQGIITGNIPPDISKETSFRDRTKVVAELQKKGFNLAQANQEWSATQKFLSSMNTEKQVRLRQAITSVKDALGGLEQLNTELGRSELAPLNRAQIIIQANSGNPLAVKYLGQINIIRDELAQVFMGGNSPTDKALDLAKETLDKNWSPKQLQAAIENVRINLGYRENAINYASVQGVGNKTNQGAGTRYLPEVNNPVGNKQSPSQNKVGKYTLVQ